jgi:uncharacterized protein YbjQ (UPF0145 family)
VLIVTTNDIPGREIQRVCGEVFGLTVRSRNASAQFGAGFKSMFGGELQGVTKNLAESRNEAMGRLIAEARNRGGNAIVAMRFDTTENRRRVDGDLRLRHGGPGRPGDRCRQVHHEPTRLRRLRAATLIGGLH